MPITCKLQMVCLAIKYQWINIWITTSRRYSLGTGFQLRVCGLVILEYRPVNVEQNIRNIYQSPVFIYLYPLIFYYHKSSFL